MENYENMFSEMSKIFEEIEKQKPFYRLDKGQLDCKSPNTIEYISEYVLKNTTLGYKSELDELKSFIVKYIKNSRKTELEKDEILIVNGCIEGLFSTLLELKDKKKNILIPEPCWPVYYDISIQLGYRNKNYDFLEYSDINKLIEVLNQKEIDDTYILLINSPHNPTGIIIDYEKMKDIVTICDKKGITLISDEVYYEFETENKKSISPIEISENKDNIIVISSFSKNLSMAGYRVGFIIGNKEYVKRVKKIHKMITGGISPITQIAVAGMAKNYKKYIMNNVRKIDERRKVAIKVLGKEKIIDDTGGIYLFLNCNNNSKEIYKKLLKMGIACIPGTCMGENCKEYIRIGLIMEKENIKDACKRIRELIVDNKWK